MSGPGTKALYEHLIGVLASSPRRPVARLLPGGGALDVDSFERRVVGAERRLVRLGGGPGRPAVARPGAGDLVLLSARNRDSYLVALATLWKRGLVPLLADADLSRVEIADLVATFRPAACLLDRRAFPNGGSPEDLGEALPGLHAWVPGPRPGRRAEPSPSSATLARAAIVRLTSGSTGRPRGVAVTSEQLIADSRNICATMGLQPGDTLVGAIPLGHAYGFVHILMALALLGSRVVLLEQPLPALLSEALSGPGPLVLPGTPYLFDLLLQAAGRRRFKGLRLCLSAGAPLPERLSRAFKERFGLPIRTFYGASECGGICYDRSRDGILPDGCVGTPLEGVQVGVRPERGLEEGAGRIVVTSQAVALGCFPEAPAGGDPGDGVFVTSDLGRIDGDGRVHLAGRIDRLINVGGRKVNPAEVEAAIRRLPGVQGVAVFGVPDRHRGQAVCACVVATKGLTREALLAACRQRLAPFKIPRRVEFAGRLPLTARGKTDRRALAALVSPRAATTASRPA
ncbi:MAG: hypothetical protein DMF50_09230 [Acidobacteria bacterium]|nr:MAG: hypothetical protein DMF50_09230 [Acidobacteriota bacterium]